jgi:hypothetical protein
LKEENFDILDVFEKKRLSLLKALSNLLNKDQNVEVCPSTLLRINLQQKLIIIIVAGPIIIF